MYRNVHDRDLQPTAVLTFDPELRYFLGASNRLQPDPGAALAIDYTLNRRASIKDIVEALGVPHAEVGSLQLVDHGSREIGFGRLLQPGDRVRVCAHPRPRDVFTPTLLRPQPLDAVCFAVDVNAGKLASNLRLLGFDAFYANDVDDGGLADLAAEQGRIVLSKDRALLKRNRIVHGMHIRQEDPEEQLRGVLAAFGLGPPFAAFSRCLRCNIPLEPVAKEKILHRLEPLTKKYYNEFFICPECGRVYWAGSHHEALQERLQAL